MIALSDQLARRLGVTFLSIVLTGFAFAQAPKEKPSAVQLTESQKAAIAKQIKDLRNLAKGNILQRHGTAEQAFLAGASDPKKAVELYLRCYKEINFTRLEKEDRDFRDWETANEERLKFGPYASALQTQLQFLWMATRAAQAEDISTIFPDLTAYIAKIGQMSDPPHPLLDGNVGNTVFAKVYELDDLLQANDDNWELNPMNIGGIYEKTIYPYLRAELPSNLNNAWERRIQAETRLAELFIEFEDGIERYQQRKDDESGQVKGEVRGMANYVNSRYRDAMTFQKERLPVLKWGQARDQFLYVDQAQGAKAMLDLIAANIGHKSMNTWIAELSNLVNPNTAPPEPGTATEPPAGT